MQVNWGSPLLQLLDELELHEDEDDEEQLELDEEEEDEEQLLLELDEEDDLQHFFFL